MCCFFFKESRDGNIFLWHLDWPTAPLESVGEGHGCQEGASEDSALEVGGRGQVPRGAIGP